MLNALGAGVPTNVFAKQKRTTAKFVMVLAQVVEHLVEVTLITIGALFVGVQENTLPKEGGS